MTNNLTVILGLGKHFMTIYLTVFRKLKNSTKAQIFL